MAVNTTTKAELEAKLAEQAETMKALMDEIAELKKVKVAPVQKEEKKQKKQVKFINMTAGGFTISGTRNYYLEHQFDSRVFNEQEAKVIINNMPKSVSEGMLYVIGDDEFMEDCELNYDGIVSYEQMKDLLNDEASEVCAMYDMACDAQRQIIVDTIESKMLNGERVDANILVEIGKRCGKNLMSIEPMEE